MGRTAVELVRGRRAAGFVGWCIGSWARPFSPHSLPGLTRSSKLPPEPVLLSPQPQARLLHQYLQLLQRLQGLVQQGLRGRAQGRETPAGARTPCSRHGSGRSGDWASCTRAIPPRTCPGPPRAGLTQSRRGSGAAAGGRGRPAGSGRTWYQRCAASSGISRSSFKLAGWGQVLPGAAAYLEMPPLEMCCPKHVLDLLVPSAGPGPLVPQPPEGSENGVAGLGGNRQQDQNLLQ